MFHPFGGAVDIIVVKQEDGGYKTAPWYVRFGNFQGVLKRRERIVTVTVNDVEAGFHMCLDSKGEAYFAKEEEDDIAGLLEYHKENQKLLAGTKAADLMLLEYKEESRGDGEDVSSVETLQLSTSLRSEQALELPRSEIASTSPLPASHSTSSFVPSEVESKSLANIESPFPRSSSAPVPSSFCDDVESADHSQAPSAVPRDSFPDEMKAGGEHQTSKEPDVHMKTEAENTPFISQATAGAESVASSVVLGSPPSKPNALPLTFHDKQPSQIVAFTTVRSGLTSVSTPQMVLSGGSTAIVASHLAAAIDSTAALLAESSAAALASGTLPSVQKEKMKASPQSGNAALTNDQPELRSITRDLLLAETASLLCSSADTGQGSTLLTSGVHNQEDATSVSNRNQSTDSALEPSSSERPSFETSPRFSTSMARLLPAPETVNSANAQASTGAGASGRSYVSDSEKERIGQLLLTASETVESGAESEFEVTPKLKAAMDREMAWRAIVEKAAVAVRHAPSSSKQAFVAALKKDEDKEQRQKRGWGWFGWRLKPPKANENHGRDSLPSPRKEKTEKTSEQRVGPEEGNDDQTLALRASGEVNESGNVEVASVEGGSQGDEGPGPIEAGEQGQGSKDEKEDVAAPISAERAQLLVDLIDKQWSSPRVKKHSSKRARGETVGRDVVESVHGQRPVHGHSRLGDGSSSSDEGKDVAQREDHIEPMDNTVEESTRTDTSPDLETPEEVDSGTSIEVLQEEDEDRATMRLSEEVVTGEEGGGLKGVDLVAASLELLVSTGADGTDALLESIAATVEVLEEEVHDGRNSGNEIELTREGHDIVVQEAVEAANLQNLEGTAGGPNGSGSLTSILDKSEKDDQEEVSATSAEHEEVVLMSFDGHVVVATVADEDIAECSPTKQFSQEQEHGQASESEGGKEIEAESLWASQNLDYAGKGLHVKSTEANQEGDEWQIELSGERQGKVEMSDRVEDDKKLSEGTREMATVAEKDMVESLATSQHVQSSQKQEDEKVGEQVEGKEQEVAPCAYGEREGMETSPHVNVATLQEENRVEISAQSRNGADREDDESREEAKVMEKGVERTEQERAEPLVGFVAETGEVEGRGDYENCEVKGEQPLSQRLTSGMQSQDVTMERFHSLGSLHEMDLESPKWADRKGTDDNTTTEDDVFRSCHASLLEISDLMQEDEEGLTAIKEASESRESSSDALLDGLTSAADLSTAATADQGPSEAHVLESDGEREIVKESPIAEANTDSTRAIEPDSKQENDDVARVQGGLTQNTQIEIYVENSEGKMSDGNSSTPKLPEAPLFQAPSTGLELSLCRHLLNERMGIDAAATAFESQKVTMDQYVRNPLNIINNDRLVAKVDGRYYPWAAAAPRLVGLLAFGKVLPPIGVELDGAIAVEKPHPEGNQDLLAGGRGGWKLWPFGAGRRPPPIAGPPAGKNGPPPIPPEVMLAAAGAALDNPLTKELLYGVNGFYARPRKQRLRMLYPTSEQLATLPLHEGKNRITFSFTTRMLGKQQVECSLYVWRWNTRVVVSDVDGTITKSDVLGQVMPLMGRDWTQSGVARLFSAIRENGYELMFLSARAITQAYLTRNFLFNLKQDGSCLPEGPVVISPDGLFPSLYREVIRRAPHEFKIACLSDIRALFPADRNPFYAGFGNRETDEISYEAVGIPKGKIFIINPKGEVAVRHMVDVKSYGSLHSLVHDIFPAIHTATDDHPEREDFNNWNFWKMPLPDIDDDLELTDSREKTISPLRKRRENFKSAGRTS